MRSLLRPLVALALVAGCGAPGSQTAATLAGVYDASGGGGALAQVKALTDRFSQLHPGVEWRIQNVGSDASVQLVVKGETDLGFISRDLKDEEKDKVATVPIGLAGTAVAVNAKNAVTSLTKEEVRGIFTGTIANWSAVGGGSGRIAVLVREPNAATREVFEKYFFPEGKVSYAKDAVQMSSIDDAIPFVDARPEAIAMITLNDRTLGDPAMRLLRIDGVAPTKDNLASGAYQLRRPLYLVHAADDATLRPAIREFLAFVRSPEGQSILNGF